jgi:gluconate kinase
MAFSIYVIMGKSGTGPKSVAAALAAKLRWRLLDTDDLFPQDMRIKMCSGIPLTQEDRKDWLSAVRTTLIDWHSTGVNGVLRCPYLPPSDWQVLSSSIPPGCIKLVRLTGRNAEKELAWRRYLALQTDSDPKLSGPAAKISQITIHASLSEADVHRIAGELANQLSLQRENPKPAWISRDTIFGYGCLLVGIPSSYLSDKLFGAIPALIVSSVCLVIGLMFLFSVHIHDLETGALRRRIVSIIGAYSIIGAIIGALIGGLAGTIRQLARKQPAAVAIPAPPPTARSSPSTKKLEIPNGRSR